MSRLARYEGEPAFSVEEIKRRGKLVKSNERYDLYDYELGGRTYSVTELKPHQETRGHSHEGVEEWYFFKTGAGRLIVGDAVHEIDSRIVRAAAVSYKVPEGKFHKVVNTSDETMTFVATFSGSRSDSDTVYSRRWRGKGDGPRQS